MMAPYQAAIVHPGGCWDTIWSEKTPHSAVMNDFFSATDLIRVQRAPTGPAELRIHTISGASHRPEAGIGHGARSTLEITSR